MKAVLDLGVPYALAKAVYRNTEVMNDVVPELMEKTPRSIDDHGGYVVFRKTKNAWFAVACKYRNRSYRWAVWDAAGKETVKFSYNEMRQHFGRGPSEYYRIHIPSWDVWRHSKHSKPGEINPPEQWQVIQYANKVFMPSIRKRFQPVVDGIYDVIRIIPKDYDRYGNPKVGSMCNPARVQALKYAEELEDLLEAGFGRKSVEDWLASMKALHHGWGSVPANEREFAARIVLPNAKANFGKVLFDRAGDIQNSYEEMVNKIAEHKAKEKVDFSIEELYNAV